MRRSPRIVSKLAALLVLAVPGLAAASPTFPAAIKADLSLSYDLGVDHCTICHATNTGGVGTVVTNFGHAMKSAGLVLEDTSSLQAALNTLDAQGTDSDCNGTPDITQLKDGQDPNTGAYIDGSGKLDPTEAGCMGTQQDTGPSFGCGAQLSRAPAPWEGAFVVAVALGTALVRRRSPGRPRVTQRRG